MALTKDGLLAYVSCNGDSTVQVIDTDSYRVIADYAGLNVPYGVAITPDQQSVYVVNNGNSTVTVLPGLTGLHPYQGPTGGGSRVTLLGTHLTGATAVHFGPRLATDVVVVSDHEIALVTPAGHGVVDVTVTTPGGTSGPMPFYYIPPPHVTGLSPASGPVPGGTTVTLTGSSLSTARTVGFGGTVVALVGSGLAPTTEVLFGATPAPFTLVSDSLIQAIGPAHAPGAVPVTVTSPGGSATAPQPYTYA